MKRMARTPFHLALVLSAGGSPAAFDVLRSMSLGGLRTIVAFTEPNDIALFSNDCADTVRLPSFGPDNEDAIVKQLVSFAEWCVDPPVLFYASDVELSFVVRHRSELAKNFRFLLPPENLLECLFDEERFAEFAKLARLPVPRSQAVHSLEELAEALPTVEFPCVVKRGGRKDLRLREKEEKTRFGFNKSDLRIAATPEELWKLCSTLPEQENGFLLQSYVSGSDEGMLSFHGYFDENSRCLASFIGQKIRTYPPHGGKTTYAQTKHHPMLSQLSVRYLQRLKFQGMANIDFKWDRRDEEFKILEINPGFGTWQLLGAYAGVNLVHTAYKHLSGKENGPEAKSRGGVRLLDAKEDLRSFIHEIFFNRERNILGYLQSLQGEKVFRIFDREDFMPFVVSALTFVTLSIRMLLSSILRGGGERELSKTHQKKGRLLDALPPFEPHIHHNEEIVA